MRQARWKEFRFLLRREFLFQLDGRRAYPRGVYPGVNWFALLCIGALLLEFNASRLSPENSKTVVDHFIFLTLAQIFLISLRSAVYCALSMSRDLQNHTATVVRVSPISRTLSLVAKLVACLAPLWVELALFLPVSILFFSIYLWLSPALVASAIPFAMMVSLLAGCLGLAIGSTTSLPLQAIRNARLFVFFAFFVIPVLRGISDGWMLPLAAMALWLSVTTRRAPHRIPVLAAFATVITALGLMESRGLGGFTISGLHPLNISGDFYTEALHGSGLASCALNLTHPLLMGLLYLVLAGVFFSLARARIAYAR